MMFPLYLTLITLVTVVLGCSPPEGPYVPPTPAENVNYAHHVAIGEVKKRLEVDPIFDYESTYAVDVRVQCSYKGPVLKGYLTIVGAGFIPGHCTAKELEVGTKYLLFLDEARVTENGTFYEQTKMAEPYYNVSDYLDVCGLGMRYPEENGMGLKRKVCEYEKEDGPCKLYDMKTGRTVTKPRSTKPDGTMDTSTPRKEVVSVDMDGMPEGTTPKDESSGTSLSVSFGVILISLLSTMF